MDAGAPHSRAALSRGGAPLSDPIESSLRTALVAIQTEGMRHEGHPREGAWWQLAGDTMRLLGSYKRLRAA
jgi:hypothetical protein